MGLHVRGSVGPKLVSAANAGGQIGEPENQISLKVECCQHRDEIS